MPEQMENLSGKEPDFETDQKADINRKLIRNMRDLNHIMRFLYEGKASQKRILIMLNEVKSITQRDLTIRLGVQPGSASEILSKLENAGLILRIMSEADRRTANISLTEKGLRAAQEAAEQRSRRHVEMFSCLEESEKTELLSLLEKLNGDWTKRYGTAEECRNRHHHCRHECKHEAEEDEREHRHRHCYGYDYERENREDRDLHYIETEGQDHGEVH